MADLGDDAADMMFRGKSRHLLQAMRLFSQWYQQHHNEQVSEQENAPDFEHGNLVPATENQLQYLQQLMGRDAFEQIGAQNLTRDAAAQIIRAARDKDFAVFVLPDLKPRQAFAQELDERHFTYTTVPGAEQVFIFDRQTMDAIMQDIQAWQQNENIDLDAMNLDAQDLEKEALENPIKSHDGMDIDPHSAVVESNGYQWKEDIADRAAQAREIATNETQYEQELEARGIVLSKTKDGEYLYSDAKEPWHKVRGDTLGDKYKAEYDKPMSFEERAKDAREVSQLAQGMRDDPVIERGIITR